MAEALQFLPSTKANVGAGSVDRYLPRRARRLVGAWCFFDAFGGGGSTGVGPHPHIGIKTATWLTEGRSVHRDSLGSLTTVEKGHLALMTAGSGIAHAEEPQSATDAPHGVQLWIAL